MARNTKASNYDNNLYQTPIYRSWYNMKSRCLNPKYTNFSKWGGRGITVCEEWMKFDGFLKDMHQSYIDGFQLDRINNDGNYEKENCRWTDRKTQCRNRSNNKFIEYNGISKTIAEWAEISGVKSSLFRQRLYVNKLPFDKCLVGYKNKRHA